MRLQHYLFTLLAILPFATGSTQAQNTSQLSESGWFSDDTRADGAGTQSSGTNLISPQLTDDPEASASGDAAHDADITSQIAFGSAPGAVPTGTHRGAVHMSIAAAAGSGKSQITDRKDDGTGHATGAAAFGAGMTASYSWMGDGTASVTASLKFGVKTADFGSTGVSSRTGENVWDKVFIYEPGNLNGGTSNGLWQTETIDFTTGRWWFFDRTVGASIIGTPMTLSDMSTSLTLVGGGPKTVADVYALVTAPGAHITSTQFGIGSGNAGGSVFVNELTTNFYRSGSTTTFGTSVLLYDQNVTSNAIFGSGNINGGFTVDRNAGVEIGLRGKVRFPVPLNIFNSNGDGTYTFTAGAQTGVTPLWAFEWSVNTDFDGSTSQNLDALTYEIGIDYDSGVATNFLVFDNITAGSTIPYTPPAVVPFWDHSIGTNATAQGAGAEAVDPGTYATLVANNNLAQNSWRMDFFDEFPFDIFDPDATGRYEIYVAAFDGGNEVARSHITIIVERPLEFDQNVTNNIIFGSGNLNGAFTTDRHAGVELGLRGKVRFPVPLNVFNSNGDGTYTFDAGAQAGVTPLWSFEWSANTDFDASSGVNLDALTYELGIDFDPGSGTNYNVFDNISPGSTIPYIPPVVVPFWDHAIGTNATGAGLGTVAGDALTYAGLIANNNLAQNSWRMDFFDEFPFDIFDPTVAGRYEFYLAARDGGGVELARTHATIIALNGASLTLEASPCQTDQDLSLPGVQIEVELWMRNLQQDVTGFQAFLAFDDAALTYEGASSSYTASPFGTHIQLIATAELAAGELTLDGNAGFPAPVGTSADSQLATLVFTVATECDPVSLDFDTGAPFSSELSFEGNAIATAVVDSGAIVPDATPPILTVPADITVTADAGVGGGCTSAVVNFTATAVDLCSSVSVVCTPPSGTAFPAGATTTVTCIATDACGNTDIETFDVTVTLTNTVCLDIQLVGSTMATTRCIRLVPNSCASAVDLMLPFDATGLFTGEVEIPCGTWTLLCGKDRQHTLWDTVTLALNGGGTKYVASATLTLDGGDTDDDGDVDINDVTLFLLQFGQLAVPGGCPFDGISRDADFSNNGAVGSEDYTSLTNNWLSLTSCACALVVSGGGHNHQFDRPLSKVASVQDSGADINADGQIDWQDVEIFEIHFGLSGELSKRMRASEGKVRTRFR